MRQLLLSLCLAAGMAAVATGQQPQAPQDPQAAATYQKLLGRWRVDVNGVRTMYQFEYYAKGKLLIQINNQPVDNVTFTVAGNQVRSVSPFSGTETGTISWVNNNHFIYRSDDQEKVINCYRLP
jgi:hypothetical protein